MNPAPAAETLNLVSPPASLPRREHRHAGARSVELVALLVALGLLLRLAQPVEQARRLRVQLVQRRAGRRTRRAVGPRQDRLGLGSGLGLGLALGLGLGLGC